jgi:hypothetical protein
MVQIYPQTTSSRINEEAGRNAGAGISEVLQEAGEYKRNRSRLQDALKSISEISPDDRKDPTKLLTSIISATAGIPGAERYVSPVFDTLIKQQNSIAQKNAAIGRKKQGNIPNKQVQSNPATQAENQPNIPQGEDYFRNPTPPESGNGLFPQMTSGPQTEPELSPDDLNDYASDLVEKSNGQMDWNQAYAAGQKQNDAIRDKNDKIEQQRNNRSLAIEKQATAMVDRARDANLVHFPGADTIAANAAYESRNAETPEKQWQYVQTQLKAAEDAYNGIVRTAGPAGPLGNFYRKNITGNYREKEQIFKDIQPYIKYYKDKGLFNELRGVLSGELGLGAEDVETAMFPPNQEEKKFLDKFPINSDRIEKAKDFHGLPGVKGPIGDIFPDERYKTDQTGYNILKHQLKEYLQKNPQANLIALRGRLNQDKRYYWGDISNAIQELADEKSFGTKNGRPDQVQQQQMQVIKQAPIPSLWNQFQYYWREKK